MIEEDNQLVDIAALTLFYGEKFFSAVKLAVVSFNNLLVHFEEEFKEYYMGNIRNLMMPFFNEFK